MRERTLKSWAPACVGGLPPCTVKACSGTIPKGLLHSGSSCLCWPGTSPGSPAPQPAPQPQTLPRQVESSLNNTKANDSCWALVSLASASSSCSRAYSRIDQECARALGCGVLANLRHELQKLGSLQRVDGPRLSSSFTGHLQASSGKGSAGTSREHTECL